MPISEGAHQATNRAEGQGRSGGYRTMIAFNQNDRSFFMYGFAKN